MTYIAKIVITIISIFVISFTSCNRDSRNKLLCNDLEIYLRDFIKTNSKDSVFIISQLNTKRKEFYVLQSSFQYRRYFVDAYGRFENKHIVFYSTNAAPNKDIVNIDNMTLFKDTIPGCIDDNLEVNDDTPR